MERRLVVIRGLKEGRGRREVDVDIKDNMRYLVVIEIQEDLNPACISVSILVVTCTIVLHDVTTGGNQLNVM